MKQGFLMAWFLGAAAIGGVAWWYLFTAGSVPAGQRPLGDAATFRDGFARGVEKNRIVALLSPTTPADLVTASNVQALLMEYENDTLDAFIIWIPKQSGDWAPTTDAMARVWDPRVRHFWDKEKTLPAALGEGSVFLYARGAGLDKPVVRVKDWQTGVLEIRAFLGTPKPQTQP